MHKSTPPLPLNSIAKPFFSESIYHRSCNVKSGAAFLLGKAANEATVAEILTKPKPGLVDPSGGGCHMDMDWRTLSASAEALAPFWQGQALTGLEGTAPRRAMTKLRRAGLEMDAAMLKATKGVNTHKGLIYIMSLLLYGAGYSIYKKMEITAGNVAKLAAETVKGSVERELLPLKKNDRQKTLSNGEKLFLLHGITGARGEAENAFPSITETGLPELRRNLDRGVSFNDASLCALLAIMEINEDSNVIHRGGFDFWQNEYKNLAAEARLAFRPDSGDYSPLEALEKRFLPLRVSPGGAADLLACTLFLNFVTVPTCHH